MNLIKTVNESDEYPFHLITDTKWWNNLNGVDKWANIWFYKNIIAINSTDLRDASKVYTGGYLSSERQRYANTAETQLLEITANWDGPHIDIEQSVEQESTGNFAKLGADIDFYPDSTVLRFKNNSTT